jgi:hypothetical protein
MACVDDVAELLQISLPLALHEVERIKFLCGENWPAMEIALEITTDRRIVSLRRKLLAACIQISASEWKEACAQIRGGAPLKRVFESIKNASKAIAAKAANK